MIPSEHRGELVLLRNSERSTYRRCRLKWWWSYVERRTPDRDKGALVFGRLVHAALEVRYPPGRKRGPHPTDTFRTLMAGPDGYDFSQWDEEGNKIPALELGAEMLDGYVRTYGKDDAIKIIQPEQVIAVDVYDRNGKYLCTWVGKVDAVYEYLPLSTPRSKCFGMLEHKTAKTVVEELRINSGYGEQGLSYFWAGDYWLHHEGLLKPAQHIDHIHYNWLRKALPSDAPRNSDGHVLNKPTKPALVAKATALGLNPKGTIEALTGRLGAVGVDVAQLGQPSKRQPGPLYHRQRLEIGTGSLDEINRRIRAEAWEMAQVKAGKLPLIKNPTKDCDWDCPFVEACELHEMGFDYQSMLDIEYTTWNPYEEHELELERTR